MKYSADPDGNALQYDFQADQNLNAQLDNNHLLTIMPSANYNGITEVTVTATMAAVSVLQTSSQLP